MKNYLKYIKERIPIYMIAIAILMAIFMGINVIDPGRVTLIKAIYATCAGLVGGSVINYLQYRINSKK